MKPMIYRTSKINLEAILFFLNRRINQTLRYSGWTPVTMDLLGIQAAIPQGRAFKPKANAFQVLMTKCAVNLAQRANFDLEDIGVYGGYHIGVAHILHREEGKKRDEERLIIWIWSMSNPNGFEEGLPTKGVISAGWI